MDINTVNYFKSLNMPNGRKPAGRKAWGIDLQTIWIPWFHASNMAGATHLPPDALGAPIRLAYEPDGSVRFSRLGKPITRTAKDLADAIRIVRDNFTAGLVGHTERAIAGDKAGYKAQVELARKAGEPIITNDQNKLDKALILAMEVSVAKLEAKAEAEAEASAEVKAKVPVTA